MFGRDKSERFKSSLPSPGPGDYNPGHIGDLGYKADPTSGFKGSGRFSENEDESGRLSGMSMSPRRRIPSRPGSRTTDWTSNRIKDLETELRISKAKISELQQIVRESGMSPGKKEEFEEELRELNNKLLTQKGSTAQAQRETIKVQGEKKRVENELANMTMRVKKVEESRKIAEAKVSEAKVRVAELERQVGTLEEDQEERDEAYRQEVQALKKRLAQAESSASNQEQFNAQLSQWQTLSHVQQEQLSSMEEELNASKAAAENLISENLAQILVMRAELTVAGEHEAENEELIANLRGEIQDLKDRLESALAEKAELEKELARMRAENEEKVQQLAVLTGELESAQKELQVRDQLVLKLETDLMTMRDDNQSSQHSLKEAENLMEALKADLESKSEDVHILEAKVVEMAQTLGEEFSPEEKENLSKMMEKFSSVVAARQERIQELEKQTEGQASELKHLGNKVATVLKEKKAKVGELERQKKEEKSLRRSLAEQENKMNHLNQQLDAAESNFTEESETRVQLQNELRTVRLQLGEKTVEAAEWQQKTEELIEQTKDGDAKARTIAALQAELEKAKTDLANRQSKVEGLQHKVEKLGSSVGAKGNTLTALQEELKKLGSEKTNLQTSLTNAKKELAQAKSECKRKEDVAAELKREVTKLETRLNKAMENKKKAEETAEQALKQKTDLEDKLAKSKSAFKNAQATVTAQTQELAKLGAERRELELQSGSQNLSDRGSSQITKKLETLQITLKERDDEVRQLQAELDEIARSTDDVKGAQAKAQLKLSKAEKEVRTKTALAQELQTQLNALKHENVELLREKEQVEDTGRAKLADREKKLQRLERELNQLKEKLGEAQSRDNVSDVATENELRSMLKEQKKRYESQIRSLKLEPTSIKELRSEVAAAQAIANSARKQNEILKEQLRETKGRLAFFEGTNPEHDEMDEVEVLKEALREAERKVNDSQRLAAQYRQQLRHSDTVKLEMERLEEENLHLHRRSEQLSADMTGLMQSSGSFLGHHNSRQKIQYHLKLKTELEEMRQQYTILSREKFKLEQAIRYMAARADLLNGNPTSDVTGTTTRNPSAAVAPASTKDSVVLSTPTAKKHMKWASRGKGMTKNMSAYKPRDSMERGIEQTQIATVVETEAFKQDVSQAIEGPSDPTIYPISDADHVESRILSTIVSVVSHRRRRKGLTE